MLRFAVTFCVLMALSVLSIGGCKAPPASASDGGTATADAAPPSHAASSTATISGDPRGRRCSDDSECRQPRGCEAKCVQEKVGTPGTCTIIAPNGKEGDACVGNREGNRSSYAFENQPARGYLCDVYANDAYCDGHSGRCTKTKPLGAKCQSHAECGKGMCGPPVGGRAGSQTCVERPAAGTPCSDDYQCALTASCDTKTKKCVPRKSLGASCATSDECVSFRCLNSKCANDSHDVCEQ